MSEIKYKILVTHPEVPTTALTYLRNSNAEVIVCEHVPPLRSEILRKSDGVDAILWACDHLIDAEALDAAGDQLKAISTMSSEIEYVDLDEVKRRGILLGNTLVLSDAVADMAIGLLLAAARRFQEGRQKLLTSTWENYHHQWMLGQDIRDSTVGFLGFGGVGKAIAKRLSGFYIGRILYCSRNRLSNDDEYSAIHVPFDQLLSDSDFLFIACPLTDETKGLFNEKAFNQMRPNCVLVNVSDEEIIDQSALHDALKRNTIFAAGLDIKYPNKIKPNDPLLTLPNCVTIPHLGSATPRTRTQMAMLAAENIVRGLKGEKMISPAF